MASGNGVDGVLDVAKRGALGLHALAAGGRGLAGGQPVNLVVHHDVSQVHVAAHGVGEMVAADAEAVAIAAGADDLQLVVAELDAGADGEGAAVQGVHAVGVDEAGQVGGTADAADGHHLVRLQAQFEQRGLQRGQHRKIPAAGAPIGVDFAFIGVLVEEVGCGGSRLRRERGRCQRRCSSGLIGVKHEFRVAERKVWTCRRAVP